MKPLICALVAAVLLGGVCGNAAAIDPTRPQTPAPRELGTWRAKVKWVNPHPNPDGTYATYSYANITATTQTYCQNQLQSYLNSGASVDTPCWFDTSTW